MLKDPKAMTDSNLIAPLLPLKSQITELISLRVDSNLNLSVHSTPSRSVAVSSENQTTTPTIETLTDRIQELKLPPSQ
jgi:hypothetical protein